MLYLTCCGCGCNLATKLSEAVDIEFDRRDCEQRDGFHWPVIGIMCVPCEADMRAFTDTLDSESHV